MPGLFIIDIFMKLMKCTFGIMDYICYTVHIHIYGYIILFLNNVPGDIITLSSRIH